MKLLFRFIILAFVIVQTGCTTAKVESTNSFEYRTDYIWINSYKVPCASVGKSDCYTSQTLEIPESYAWRTFYNDISGFKYQYGYLYFLKVRVDFADNGSTRYALLEEVNKIKDYSLSIKNTWLVTEIFQQEVILEPGQLQPYIDLTKENGLASVNTGCNQISGTTRLTLGNQISFNLILRSKKLCPNIELEDQFLDALNKAYTYEINENDELVVYDLESKLILKFKKL